VLTRRKIALGHLANQAFHVLLDQHRPRPTRVFEFAFYERLPIAIRPLLLGHSQSIVYRCHFARRWRQL
jgi:hypothetical protein